MQPGRRAHAFLFLGAAAVAGTAALAVCPSTARACGACVGPPTFPVLPQADERILFLVEDDGAGDALVTFVTQIRIAGECPDFAWVLPIPEVPEDVDVAPADFFEQLDAATAPTFQFPFEFNPRACSIMGCGCSARASGPDLGGEGESPVNVWGKGAAGPYEMAIISSATVDPLIEWMQRHGYGVPDGFTTIADVYVRENFKFLVLRMAPEAGVTQLLPIVVRYREYMPCIPLRMTSITAVPEMGVRVYVVGPGRAVPLNYGVAAPDWTKIATTPGGVDDYDALVSAEVELEGGRAWVTEFARPVGGAFFNDETGFGVSSGAVVDYLGKGAWVTRLYTRISPWEMTEDPFFTFEENGVEVTNLHVLAVEPAASASMLPHPGLLGDILLLLALAGVAGVTRLRRAR